MNRYLNSMQNEGLLADVRKARQALDALEAVIKADTHPNRISDYVRDVERWMAFAHSFCREAAIHDLQRETKMARLTAYANEKGLV